MLVTEQYPYGGGAMANHELLEVHRSKISLHRAKADYSYPTIRLPYTFSKLAGLPTRIYQTVHNGALAFLVVVSSDRRSAGRSEGKDQSEKSDRLYTTKVGVQSPRAHLFFQ